MKRKTLGTTIICLATALSLSVPSMAFATADNEKEMPTEEEIIAAEESGLIETEPYREDASDSGVFSSRNYPIKTYAGNTLYDTAAEIALEACPQSDWVIVASGNSFVDALAASSLAGALKCPILLTDRDYLPSVTKSAVESMGARNIVIVGGNAVVSPDVESALSAYGSVTRLSGETQYDTQIAIYEFGLERDIWSKDTIIAASGSTYEVRAGDALSISPLAYKEAIPVFLVDGDGNLPKRSIDSLAENSSATEAIAVGGTVVVSEKTLGALDYICYGNNAESGAVRIAGETNYDTSRAVAEWATSSGRLSWENAAFATASKPYDALAGSALQGSLGSVLLLADESAQRNMELLQDKNPASYAYFGGSYWFTNVLKAQYALKQGHALNDIEDFVLYLDAGHGYNSSGNGVMDPGAYGCGYREADLTYELAQKVAAVLRNEYGMAVYVNNSGYYKFRQAEAYNMNCGAFVSLHFNAGGGRGSESYIHSYNAAEGSDILQDRAHAGLISGLGLKNRGQFEEAFAVCGGEVPAVLLEVCFIDSWSDMNTYRSRIDSTARGIAAGIAE